MTHLFFKEPEPVRAGYIDGLILEAYHELPKVFRHSLCSEPKSSRPKGAR